MKGIQWIVLLICTTIEAESPVITGLKGFMVVCGESLSLRHTRSSPWKRKLPGAFSLWKAKIYSQHANCPSA